jgi:hypothetical protein
MVRNPIRATSITEELEKSRRKKLPKLGSSLAKKRSNLPLKQQWKLWMDTLSKHLPHILEWQPEIQPIYFQKISD